METRKRWVVVLDDELYHHGILGQKWGVRRFQNPDGSLTPAGLKRQARQEARAAKKEARKAEKKAIAESKRTDYEKMTDEELRRVINRKQLENQYINLTKKPEKRSSVAGQLLKEAATNFGRKALGKLVDKAVDRLFEGKTKEGVEKYNLSDPTKASLSMLQEANKYFSALKNYRENKDAYETRARNDSQDWMSNLGARERNKVPYPNQSSDLNSDWNIPYDIQNMQVRELRTKRLALPVGHSELKDDDLDYLAHYGIKGQKYGVRRFETEDGHLTEAGKRRYLDDGDGGQENASHRTKSSGSSGETDAATTAKVERIKKMVADRAEQQTKRNKDTNKKKGKGGKGKKDSGSEKKAKEEKTDWRDRMAEELRNANMSDEELEKMLDQLYPDRKKKIGVGIKTVVHSEDFMDTHWKIERDGDYLEHFGVKGMKWKQHKAKSLGKEGNISRGVNSSTLNGTDYMPVRARYSSWKETRSEKPQKDPHEITVKEKRIKPITIKESFYPEQPNELKKKESKPGKKKKSKAKSYISSKVKDASIAYESGKARLKKLFGG